MKYILEVVHKWNKPSNPVVVCGDFNSKPDSAVYQLITTGKVDPAHPDFQIKRNNYFLNVLPTSPLGEPFKSVYSNYTNGVSEPLFTNYTATWNGTIDFIFYRPLNMKVKKMLSLPTVERITKETAIPNKEFPSDHIPLMSHFELIS